MDIEDDDDVDEDGPGYASGGTIIHKYYNVVITFLLIRPTK